jgi:holo-[acyl-carrier protein] synthase
VIVGIGVDLVDIARFERTLERTPRLLERLFSPAERTRSPRSLAARYAAKEALIKALGGSDGVHWTEIEITPEASGRPWFTLTGSTADVIAERGITGLHLSMSHDAGFATAFVVAEASGDATGGAAGAWLPGTGSEAGRDDDRGPRAEADPEARTGAGA